MTLRWLAISILVLLSAGAASAFWAWHWYDQPGPLTAAQVVTIEPGAGLGSVSRTLSKAGAVEHRQLFRGIVTLLGFDRRLQAGEYQLAAAVSPKAIVTMLSEGRVVMHEVVLVEGMTLKQALQRLHDSEFLVRKLGGVEDVSQSLQLETENPEGLFFPDTYRVVRGTTDVDVLRVANSRMRKILAEEWQQRDPAVPLQTPYEALVLASIVEKETGRPADRSLIAQVFLNRLRQGMRLQTDPTVIYGLGDRFDGDLKRVHLRTDSPYNTYTRHGLPPTPIALAGRASLHAALHPSAVDYLYFVARGDGSSQFSRTLEEHRAAVRRFQG